MSEKANEALLMNQSERIRSLFILLAVIIGSILIANLLSGGLWSIYGIDITEILEGASLDKNERIVFRLGLMINHFGTFLLPAIIYCLLFLKDDTFSFLKLDQKVELKSLVLWGILILFSYPLIAQLTQWNLAIPLPDWMASSQTHAFALLEQTLKMESVLELFISILLVGVLAALGEELIFRGIVQNQLLRVYNNPHIAIILSAIIFGGFHMQFERIIPLSLLGLFLGYSYYYSKSLLVPIILHFINNTFQILSIYFVTRAGEMPAIDEVPQLPWSLVLSSFFITILLFMWAVRMSKEVDESRS